MKIFDLHTHIFPDSLAPNALAHLTQLSGGQMHPSFDGTRQGLLRQMEQSGITAAINAPIATKASQVASINTMAAGQAWPLISFGSLHPDTPDKRTVLEGIRAAGLHGLKLHPEYQAFRLQDPRMAEAWAAGEELGLAILFHAGYDIAYPPPCQCMPEDLAWLHQRYPGLKIIAAHFGGWRAWDVLDPILGSGIHLELSLAQDDLAPETMLRLIRQHGADKVCFGTDTPWNDPAKALRQFLELELTPAEQQAILWDNAIRLLGI